MWQQKKHTKNKTKMNKTMTSMPIKKTNKRSRKKERRKRGKTMEEGREKLDLLHPLGVARYFSPPLSSTSFKEALSSQTPPPQV